LSCGDNSGYICGSLEDSGKIESLEGSSKLDLKSQFVCTKKKEDIKMKRRNKIVANYTLTIGTGNRNMLFGVT